METRKISIENFLNITLDVNEWSHMNKGRINKLCSLFLFVIYDDVCDISITPRGPHRCGGHEPGYDKRSDQPHGHHLNQEEGRDDGGDLQHGELQMSPHNTKKKDAVFIGSD